MSFLIIVGVTLVGLYAIGAVGSTLAEIVYLGMKIKEYPTLRYPALLKPAERVQEARQNILTAWIWPLRLVRALLTKLFGNLSTGLITLIRGVK